ncbi:hypothetical protein ACFV23_04090 [Streptomyces sp. NPDC059627]
MAVHPGVATRHIAQIIGASERVVARSLDRLTNDGLPVLDADDPSPALRSYRLAS